MLIRVPFFQAAQRPVFRDTGYHSHGPVYRGNQVDIDDTLEVLLGIDVGLARFPVDLDGQGVKRDTGCRDANTDKPEPGTHFIIDTGTERIVRHVPAISDRNVPVDLVVDLFDGDLRLFGLIHHGNFPDAPAGQFQ